MDRQLLLEATGTLLAFLVFYCLWKAKASTGISAPQPKGAWPVIGHLHLLGGKTPVFRTLAAMADKHGQIFTIQIGMRRALVVSGKETIMECFTTNDCAFVSRPKFAAAKYMGYDGAISALGPHGPYWRELRKVMTLQLLSNRRLELMKHLRATEVGFCINDLYSLCVKQLNGVSEGLDNFHKPGATKVDMTHWFRLATMNLMLRAIAGRRYGLSEDEKDGEARLFIRAMDQFMFLTGSFECSDVIPFIKWMDLQGHVRLMKQNAKVLDCFMSRWLEEHVQSRKNGQVKPQEQDFLDVFLSIFPEDGMEHGHTNKSIIKGNALFEDILDLHDLKDVVSSQTTVPIKRLEDGSINLEYSKDKLVLSWIKATSSPTIQTLLLSCSTAYEAWTLLEKRLSPLSKIHIRTLRDRIRNLKVDAEKPIGDFLLQAKSIADSLAAAGSPILDSELIDYIIDALGGEYKEFITSLHLRPTNTFDDFYDLLLQEEHLLKRMTSLSLSTGVALAATRLPQNQQSSAHKLVHNSHHNNNQTHQNFHHNNNQPHQNFHHNNNRGRGGRRGRGGNGYHSGDNRRPPSTPLAPDNRPPLLPTPTYRPLFHFSRSALPNL